MTHLKDGRKTVYNSITSDEKLRQVNPENLTLENDFLDYLASIDRSKGTITQYRANLHVFWCWNLEFNKNKFFVDLTKREIAKFQNHAINVWKWSPRRIRTVKATISSLSNFVENILDDEYEGYKPIVRKIESPKNVAVREKTVFQEDELQKLLDYLVENEEYIKACVLSLAMNSGRRKAELLRFKAGYFDKSNLICDGGLYKTPEEVKTKGHGSYGKPLTIYTLAKPFQPYLDLWMQKRKELKIKSEWLFPRYYAGQWLDEPMAVTTLDSWARNFGSFFNKPFYWHSLRHYLTTKLHESGMPDNIIQTMIGWESADMLNIYIDTEADKQFEQYFGADGIKKGRKFSLEQL